MSEAKDNDERDDIDFSWGIKRGRGGQKKDVQFYESFTYDGVDYFLYDSIYLFKEGEAEPYIGKLIKIWENSNKSRKVKVLWFFFPSEISNYLKGENVLEKELFLASGVGKGLANINPLEAIAGKCNVVCISKDERNRQPAVEELKMAHHVFYRTFDVQNYTVSDTLGEKIAMTEVNLLLNKKIFQSIDLPLVDSGNATLGLVKPLISHKYTLAADGTMEHEASVGSLLVKDNKEANSVLDKPVKNIDAARPDNIVLGVGREKMLDNKDPGVDGDVDYDGSVGSLLVKDDKGSKGKGDAAGPDDLGLVALPAADVALACSGIKRSRFPDSKKNYVNENCVAPPVTAADNKKSKPVMDNRKANSAVAKVKSHSDEKPLKKLKTDGTDLLSSDNGGTSIPKPATAVSNKGSQSVGTGTDFNNSGRLTKEFGGINNFPKNLNSEDKSDDKLREVSVKKSKDNQGSAVVNTASNRASQSANGDAETDDKGKSNKNIVGTSNGLSKKLKSSSMGEDKSNVKLRKALIKDSKDVEFEAYGCVKEVTERPPDRSKWFTASPWEDRMKDARDQGRLILLQNLDPIYTSSEVENIVWHGFGESCTAKVVQHTATSSRSSGQAFAIFKTREVAEKIVKKLEKECLMLPDGRPLVGIRNVVCFPGKHSQFPGHLVIDKLRHQMQRESRDAVSTSHSAQPNTLEYEMALEWRLLQDRSELSWKMLYKRQGEQIKKMKASGVSK